MIKKHQQHNKNMQTFIFLYVHQLFIRLLIDYYHYEHNFLTLFNYKKESNLLGYLYITNLIISIQYT